LRVDVLPLKMDRGTLMSIFPCLTSMKLGLPLLPTSMRSLRRSPSSISLNRNEHYK